MLKHGGAEMVTKIAQLCNKIWEMGEVPKDWQAGIIIPLPKKGDLKDCNNWRGITLLSVPGKVMASTLWTESKEQSTTSYENNKQASDKADHAVTRSLL